MLHIQSVPHVWEESSLVSLDERCHRWSFLFCKWTTLINCSACMQTVNHENNHIQNTYFLDFSYILHFRSKCIYLVIPKLIAKLITVLSTINSHYYLVMGLRKKRRLLSPLHGVWMRVLSDFHSCIYHACSSLKAALPVHLTQIWFGKIINSQLFCLKLKNA